MTTAAFFDLDRTLIASSSAPVFQRHLVDAGIAPDRSLPFANLFLKHYEMFGENWLLMQPAKLAAQAAKGWDVDGVAAAMIDASAELVDHVQPYAHGVFEQHRADGTQLVIATTSPAAFVRPFAEALGFDDVIATEWKQKDGRYTGRTDGAFVWGQAKADAVAAWAEDNDCDLADCHAYSDSVYDAPMLGLVGHPVAVNPDPQLAALATLRRWPIRHLDKADGVVKIAGREIQEWGRPLLTPELFRGFCRFDADGLQHIPTDGPAIIAYNHRSYFDPSVVIMTIFEAGREVRALAKKELFDVPGVGAALRAVGTIEVDRGSGSSNPLDRAIEALDAGEVVMIAPQGTIPRGEAFFDPKIEVRRGVIELAHATRAPVIPVGLWGTEEVWPRSSKTPRIGVTDRPTVTVTVGPPVELKYRSQKADGERIRKAMQAVLPPESRRRRKPTEAELRATYPAGKYPGDLTEAASDTDRTGTT